MLEVASIFSAYLSFALLHGAEPERLPPQLGESLRAFGAWKLGVRTAALLVYALSVWLWGEAAAGAVAWTGPLAAWMVSGVLIVLLHPLCSLFVWALAAVSPPMIVLLWVFGGVYGG